MNYPQDVIDMLAQIAKTGGMTVEDFKEKFPRVIRPSLKLRSLVLSGALRQYEELFTVTTRTQIMLDGGNLVCTVAEPRNFKPTGDYTGQRMAPMRRGAEDHLHVPSLMSGQRVYRKDAPRA